MKITQNIFAIFSLTLVSVVVHAAIVDDCSGSSSGTTCRDKNVVVTTPDYFNSQTVNFMGTSQVTINKSGNINKNRLNFQANSQFMINSMGGITSSANIWVMQGATATFSVPDAMTGGSYTSNGVGQGGVLNLNASRAVSGGKLLFDQNATLNINAANAIVGVRGSNLRFKGNSVINLNHKNSLSNVTLTLEGDSRINVNTDNALGFSNNINFAKTYDTKKGSILELNGHSITVGTISGNDNNAKITNSGNNNSFIYSGLTNYGVLAGHSYNYLDLLKTGLIRSDAVMSTALGDITRQAVLTMLPKFSDRIVPEPGGMASNGQGVWLRGIYGNEKRQGEGMTNSKWSGYNAGMQIGFDVWPNNEDAKNKLGVYIGYLNSDSDIIGRSVYRDNDTIGKYHFNMYGAGIYHRYMTNQGWYLNSVMQYSSYTGNARQAGSPYKAKIGGYDLLVGTEIGYPIPITEYFTLLPKVSLDYQKLKMKDYQFENLTVHNDMDNLLRASGGAGLYYNIMSISGIQWSPFLDVNLTMQLAARDKTSVRVIDSGYQQKLLTTFAGSQAEIGAGVTVKINDYLHYYAKIELSKEFKYQSKKSWAGSTGLNFYW